MSEFVIFKKEFPDGGNYIYSDRTSVDKITFLKRVRTNPEKYRETIIITAYRGGVNLFYATDMLNEDRTGCYWAPTFFGREPVDRRNIGLSGEFLAAYWYYHEVV